MGLRVCVWCSKFTKRSSKMGKAQTSYIGNVSVLVKRRKGRPEKSITLHPRLAFMSELYYMNDESLICRKRDGRSEQDLSFLFCAILTCTIYIRCIYVYLYSLYVQSLDLNSMDMHLTQKVHCIESLFFVCL